MSAPDEEKYEHLIHDSHEYTVDGCTGCGATKLESLMRPCPNVRCSRCAALNGLHSDGCEQHGELT